MTRAGMVARKRFILQLQTRKLRLGERTLLMGVLNVTPDSFSDHGKFFGLEKAVEAALAMERAGADILDIGGESTRPGSSGTAAAEELARVLPVLEALRGKIKIPISIDTQKASVAEIALGAGAEIVNEISGLETDAALADVAVRHGAPIILMHMRGKPRTMQNAPFAKNVVRDVIGGLLQTVVRARKAGIPKSQIVIDPGIGFGKSYAQNYELIAGLPELAKLGYPLLVGPSRKGFIGAALLRGGKPLPVDQRIWGTAATVAACILNGAHIVRVHDVEEMVQVTRVTDCILSSALRPKS
jgi:dihydropteroate synthase